MRKCLATLVCVAALGCRSEKSDEGDAGARPTPTKEFADPTKTPASGDTLPASAVPTGFVLKIESRARESLPPVVLAEATVLGEPQIVNLTDSAGNDLVADAASAVTIDLSFELGTSVVANLNILVFDKAGACYGANASTIPLTRLDSGLESLSFKTISRELLSGATYAVALSPDGKIPSTCRKLVSRDGFFEIARRLRLELGGEVSGAAAGLSIRFDPAPEDFGLSPPLAFSAASDRMTIVDGTRVVSREEMMQSFVSVTVSALSMQEGQALYVVDLGADGGPMLLELPAASALETYTFRASWTDFVFVVGEIGRATQATQVAAEVENLAATRAEGGANLTWDAANGQRGIVVVHPSNVSRSFCVPGESESRSITAEGVASLPLVGLSPSVDLSATVCAQTLMGTQWGLVTAGSTVTIPPEANDPDLRRPISIAFSDQDPERGIVTGLISIGPDAGSIAIEYRVYWGSSATQKLAATPIATAKTSAATVVASLTDVAIPGGATHLLAFAAFGNDENPTPAATAVDDLGVPKALAQACGFTDTDLDPTEVAGTLAVTAASTPDEVADYVIYWGSSASVKRSPTPFVVLSASAPLSVSVPTDTAVPSSPAATHWLVFSRNADGESDAGTACPIVDLGLPVQGAAMLSFTDSDLDGGEVSGDLTIQKATDESDLTSYVLYWGTGAATKRAGAPIATIPKTGGNLVHTFAANSVVPTAPTATHLLVFSANAVGERATGTSLALIDSGLPTHAASGLAFVDNDITTGEVSGEVSITKATDESDLTHYVLYWGSNATTKQSQTPIQTIAKTGANLTHAIPANTPVPTGPSATHLLVYTKNTSGEMSTATSSAIVEASCAGAFVGGFCWYIASGSNVSCTQTCTGHGGYNDATRTYAGSSGTEQHCRDVIVAIDGGNPTVGFSDSGAVCGSAGGSGCSKSGVDHFICIASPTTEGTATGAATRFCACNQ